MLEGNGDAIKLAALETAAADQYSFYLTVLREMIDDCIVAHIGDEIKKM